MDDDLIQKFEKLIDKNDKNTTALLNELKQKARSGKLTFRDVEKLELELRKLAKTAKNNQSEFQKLADETEEVGKKMKTNKRLLDDINATSANLIGSFFSLADASKTGKENIAFMAEGFRNFPFVGAAFADLGQSLDFNIDQFRSLASVGADFNQSLVNLRMASRDAFLPLMEFTDLVASNATTLAGLFGSVNQGTAQLSQLTRSVRSNLIPEFAGLGLTTENLNEFLGTFFELQRIQNRTSFMDQEATTQAIRTYGIEIDKITRLTGVQREQINEAIRAQRDDAVFNAYLRGLGEEEETQQRALIAGLNGLNPAVADAVKNILATGFPLGEFEQTLVGTTDGLLDNILALRSGEINTVQFTSRLAQSSKTFANTFDPAVLRAGGIIGEVGNNLLALNRQFADQAELTEQQRLGIDNFTSQIGQTQEQLRILGSQFEGLNTAVLAELGPLLGSILGGTNKTLEGVNTAINFLSREAPGLVASAVIAGQAGKYIFSYAEQVAIVAAGTSLGFRGLGGTLRRLNTSVMGMTMTLLRGIAVLTGALAVLGNFGKLGSEDAEVREQGSRGLVGNVAGALAVAGGARLVGGAIGTALGGPVGLAIGATLGGAIASIIGNRDVGTIGATGLPSEPADLITKVSKGERVLNPAETAAYNSNMNDTRISEVIEANQQMVKSLNTLVRISAKTEKNTGNATRKLANMNGSLV
tara:strand:- start:792 stop:2900 length:2109 start_codon:yes stop_codon:yes gene_type:complete